MCLVIVSPTPYAFSDGSKDSIADHPAITIASRISFPSVDRKFSHCWIVQVGRISRMSKTHHDTSAYFAISGFMKTSEKNLGFIKNKQMISQVYQSTYILGT
jgi:hypothetical protein